MLQVSDVTTVSTVTVVTTSTTAPEINSLNIYTIERGQGLPAVFQGQGMITLAPSQWFRPGGGFPSPLPVDDWRLVTMLESPGPWPWLSPPPSCW